MRAPSFLVGIAAARILAFPALAEDHPCVQPQDPLVVALCSDPELRAVADQQRDAMMALWNRLSPEEQDKFRHEQIAWREITARRCRVDQPSLQPLPAETKNCLKQAEVHRIEFLRHHAQTDTPTALHPNAPPPVTSTASVAAKDDHEAAAYQDGLRDRAVWEEWFNSLQGDYKTGAFYWTSQRSLPHPGSCQQMNQTFDAGCTEAQRRLSPSDVRRKNEPEYRTGWNSWMPPAPAAPVSQDLVPGNLPAPPASHEPGDGNASDVTCGTGLNMPPLKAQPSVSPPSGDGGGKGVGSGEVNAPRGAEQQPQTEQQLQYCAIAKKHSQELSKIPSSNGNVLQSEAHDRAERQVNQEFNQAQRNFFRDHPHLDRWSMRIKEIKAARNNSLIIEFHGACDYTDWTGFVTAAARGDCALVRLLTTAKENDAVVVSGDAQAVGYRDDEDPDYLTLQRPEISLSGQTVVATSKVNDPAILSALNEGASSIAAYHQQIRDKVFGDNLQRAWDAIRNR